MKPNYIILPLLVIGVAALGSWFTSPGIEWYAALEKPPWHPPEWVFGTVWSLLYALAAVSLVIVYNYLSPSRDRTLVLLIFVANAVVNVLWSYLFFTAHEIGLAVMDAALLTIITLILIGMIWRAGGSRLKAAALLLVPYILWTGFATYLNYVIWVLNSQ